MGDGGWTRFDRRPWPSPLVWGSFHRLAIFVVIEFIQTIGSLN